MSKSTCSTLDCDRPSRKRGMCETCISRVRRSGQFAPIEGRAESLHRLTEIDEATRTATCSICGPTKIRIRRNPDRQQCLRQASKTDNKRARLRAYGLTTERYQEMVTDQQGQCGICRGEPKQGRALAIDHDHATGLVRELLCTNCNLALGHLRDNPEIAEAARDYLVRHGAAALVASAKDAGRLF